MKRHKILWLSHLVPYPPKGGVLQRAHNLLKELAKYNDIYLAAFIQPDLINSHYDNYEKGIEECQLKLEEICQQVQFFDIPTEIQANGRIIAALKGLFHPQGFSVEWLKSADMRNHLKNLNQNVSFDAIHIDTLALAQYREIFQGLPAVLDHHNIESHMMLRRAEQETQRLKKLYFYIEGRKLGAYEKTICTRFELNITCSDLDSERLQEIIHPRPLNVHSIPNGVDLAYFSPLPEPNNNEPVLIFAGGLSWYPNQAAIDFFIDDVWEPLTAAIPNLKFYLVGRNPTPKYLSFAQQHSNFIVTGFVDDVRDYLSKADVYICPIMDGGGTKLKVLDALAVGIPLVSHPIACEGIEVTEGQDVLYATTPEQWVAQIKRLIDDPELNSKIRQNAPCLIEERYSYTAIGKLFDDHIRKITGTQQHESK